MKLVVSQLAHRLAVQEHLSLFSGSTGSTFQFISLQRIKHLLTDFVDQLQEL